jgi:TonB family protein
VYFALLFLLLLSVSGGAHGNQPAPGSLPQLLRCYVTPLGGAYRPEGAAATMTVVNDGGMCVVNNWGPNGRTRSASGTITTSPAHGRADFVAPLARYFPERGYTGPDEFAYEATALDADGVAVTMHVRVTVKVVTERFPPPVQPVRLGSGIMPPRQLKDVRPVFPPEAQRAGMQGVVILEATVGADGKVTDARVMRSVPMLDSAALDAVRQWEYTPTLINGQAVPIIMTVSVSFGMQAPLPPAAATAAPALPAPSTPTALPPVETAGLARSKDSELELGLQALERRQFEEALKIYKRTSDARGKQCADCFFGMALAYEGLGAAKNVAESCDRAIALGAGNTPLVVQAHQHKGIALQMIGEYKDPKRLSEAEAEFRLALALDPDGAFLHYHLGVVLMQLQRDSEGVEELKKELAVRPRSVHADETARLIDNPRRARELYAPDVSLVTLAREFVELKDLHGKVVVLDFWGTWCPPCVKAVPDLRDLQKKHGKDAFALIGISSDTDEQILRDFVAKNQMEWTQYWDRDRKVQQIYGIRAWPTYIVIDREGVIRLRTTGNNPTEYSRLVSEVKRQLKAASRAGS